MVKDIGKVAGLIWGFLDQQTEPVTLSALKKNIDCSDMLLMMGLGWLARDDKLNMEMSQTSYKISLKRDE